MNEALSMALTGKIDRFDSPETAAAFKALLARAPLLRQHLEQAVAEG